MFNLIAFLISIFGGINWFCIGLFQFDIIAGIFGSQAHFVSRFFYCIIGICAIYSLIALFIKKGRVYEPNQLTKKQNNKPNNSDKEEKQKDKEKKDYSNKSKNSSSNDENKQNINKKRSKKAQENKSSWQLDYITILYCKFKFELN